jgi:hypothetical protein
MPLSFPPRGNNDRFYDAGAVERFTWPVVAGYEDVHRWMDRGQAVHAVWQLRDVWESLIKFLGTLATTDHLASAPPDGPHSRELLSLLINDRGLVDVEFVAELKSGQRLGMLKHSGALCLAVRSVYLLKLPDGS